MRRPERQIIGPRAATVEDVTSLNRLFSASFSERYQRDGMVGVRVPELNPDVWLYAIRDAGDGAMLWYDEQGGLVAFNVAHCSGTEGWMGPLAVRTDWQERGVGRQIVTAAIDWLRARSVSTLGLETMPRTIDNIGFYSRLGFTPEHLTVTFTGDGARRALGAGIVRLRDLSAPDRTALIARCRERLQQSASGYDFSREIELTLDLSLGDAIVLDVGGSVAGFALFHSAPLAVGRPADDLRVLKLFAESEAILERLLAALEVCAATAGLRSVAIRCQSRFAGAYRTLVRRRYRVRWTDLRMTLDGFPEAAPPDGEVLLSNWEI